MSVTATPEFGLSNSGSYAIQWTGMRGQTQQDRNRSGRNGIFLSTLTPTMQEWWIAIIAGSIFLLGFLLIAPAAATPLPPLSSFISIDQSLLVMIDLFVAALLVSHCAIRQSPALYALAGGYLFVALITIIHMLAYPGVLSTTGLLGASRQSATYLSISWHGGFSIAVIVYALLKRQEAVARPGSRMIGGLFAVLGMVVVLTALATAGSLLLPAISVDNSHPLGNFVLTAPTWVLGTIALGLLLLRRQLRGVLDLWLMVATCAGMFDTALSEVLSSSPSDLSFYAGRIEGLLAAGFVLVMLLGQTLVIYRRLAVANEFLADLACRDGLTGIFNRRAFDARLKEELSRTQRTGQPVSLLLIDVDRFKMFNDTCGHLDGDACLREIARVVASSAKRPGDLAARFGGEEFAIILPGADVASAKLLAEIVRVDVLDTAIPHAASPTGVVTVSIGVATLWPHIMSTVQDLIGAADRALYEAKADGRNQIVSAREAVSATDCAGDGAH